LSRRGLRQGASWKWFAGIAGVMLVWCCAFSIAAETLPPERSALVLYKCLPYNQAWDGLESIEIEVLVLRQEDLESAENFAAYLGDIATRAREKDPSSPAVRARGRTVGAAQVEGYSDSPPQILFLLSTENTPSEDALRDLQRMASQHSILLVTDQTGILDEYAALGFVLSETRRPEIVIDLERARLQGARFRAGFVRLARQREGGR